MLCTASNRRLVKGIGLIKLWLGATCLLIASGCSRPVTQESPQAGRASHGSEAETMATSPEIKALADRLKLITEEVERSPERRVYGVRIPANYQVDREFPLRVCEVVMSVNVETCNDGCVNGPANTPAKDGDLLLLRPFAGTLKTLDLQHTEITDAALQTVAELTALESLNLAGTAIRGSGLIHLSTLNKLQHLDLSETKVGPEHLQALGTLISLRTIQVPKAAITDEVLTALGRLPHLQSLALAKTSITDRGLESLTQLKSLETLDLSGTGITDVGLAHLANLMNLKQLHLSQTQITGAGLSHLGRLTHLQELVLTDTLVDDAGLTHLSGLKELRLLQLAGTQVRGYGLADLRVCRELRRVTLPPIPATAVKAVNAAKSWDQLSFRLASADGLQPTNSAASVTISDMPELSYLGITSECPLDAVRVVGCPRLVTLRLSHDTGQHPGAAIHLEGLPALQQVYLAGAFRQIDELTETRRLTRLDIDGALASDAVQAISRCQSLERLDMKIADVMGAPLPIAELAELPHVQSAHVQLAPTNAAWLTRLIGKMPALQQLQLYGRGLTAPDLTPLSHCTRLTEISLAGIDDTGEPLTFLDSMPALDRCTVGGCPRVGRVRLTKRSGLRQFHIGSGRLDELEIDGAPNLNRVDLGWGSASHGKLGIGRLAVRGAPNLQYLMVDAVKSTLPFTEISLADCPKLRSLLFRAPSSELQPAKCRLTTDGTFPQLVQRRLIHLRTDEKSLARLNGSPLLSEGYVENVQIDPANEQ